MVLMGANHLPRSPSGWRKREDEAEADSREELADKVGLGRHAGLTETPAMEEMRPM